MSIFKRHIFVCINQRSPDDPRGSCSKLGSEALHARFKQEAKRLNLKDVVRANKAGCLDHCALGPSVVIYPEGVWYSVKTEADVTEIMERHIVNGEVVTRLLMPNHPAPDKLLPLSILD
ncbi:MAG TPA: (2Fe-2S) ferredoxin domain-containing protein [Nitrospira sp.]|nr:(2Fe-2S) ferredoxin domain-containing protein [Nitrospira sp.]